MSLSSDDGEFSWEDLETRLEALAAVDGDLTEGRFNRTPEWIASPPKNITPKQADEEQLQARKRQRLETDHLHNSSVFGQFSWQSIDEEDRMRLAKGRGFFEPPLGFDWTRAAEENVKYRWIEQGIWNEQWGSNPIGGFWKHEKVFLPPLAAKPSEVNPQPRPNAVSTPKKRKRLVTDADDLQNSAPEICNSVERDASRPCHQFAYQFRKEREWVMMGLSDREEHEDIDAAAYRNVKARWIDFGIWDSKWAQLPGVSWKHERPCKYPISSTWRQQQEHAKRKAEILENQPPRTYFVPPHDGYQPNTEQEVEFSGQTTILSTPYSGNSSNAQSEPGHGPELCSPKRQRKGEKDRKSSYMSTLITARPEGEEPDCSKHQLPSPAKDSHRLDAIGGNATSIDEKPSSFKPLQHRKPKAQKNTRHHDHRGRDSIKNVGPKTTARADGEACSQPPMLHAIDQQTAGMGNLERAKRQFFQWYWKEQVSLRNVKKKFDKLSEDLKPITGESFVASQAQWAALGGDWNKLWHLSPQVRGLDVTTPENSQHLPLWREGERDVGDWEAMKEGKIDSSQNVSSDGHPQEHDSQAARTPNTFRSARTSVTRNVSRNEARSSKPSPGKKGKRKDAEMAGESSMPPDLVKGSRRNLRRKRSSR